MLVEELQLMSADGHVALAGGVCRSKVETTTYFTTNSVFELACRCDVAIDFSTPDLATLAAQACAQEGVAYVTGTTGFTTEQQDTFTRVAKAIPVLASANMSLGVAVLTALVEQAVKALPDWDIEILETHHRHKADAPSGTALLLGDSAAAGRGTDLAAQADWARHGVTGPRRDGRIGFAVRRGGDVVGEHTVGLYGQGERVELSHVATDRRLFAKGAIRAALWLAGKPPGSYAMADVLGLA